MASYRLYFIGAETGHIQRFEAFEADDDEMAIRIADAHQGRQAMELWCGGRKIYDFDAVIPRPQPSGGSGRAA